MPSLPAARFSGSLCRRDLILKLLHINSSIPSKLPWEIIFWCTRFSRNIWFLVPISRGAKCPYCPPAYAHVSFETETETQARNQLRTPGGAKSFLRGAQIFGTMSNNFKRRPIHFSWGAKKIPRWLCPLVMGLLRRYLNWNLRVQDRNRNSQKWVFRLVSRPQSSSGRNHG